VVTATGRSAAELHRNSSRKSASRALIVVAVVLLAGLAAIASRSPLGESSPSSGPSSIASPPAVPTPWVIAVMVVGGGVALFVVIYSLRTGARFGSGRRKGGKAFGLVSAVQLVVIAGVLAVAVALLAHKRHPHRPASLGAAGRGGHAAHSGGSALPIIGWLPYLALTALVLIDLVILVVAFAPARRGNATAPSPEVARSAVEASLDALESEPDPRRAVIAAYRRMELALSDAGLPRRAAESPREYLRRVLGSLEVSAGPLRTLTALFERARFSVRRIGEVQRDEAVGALIALRDELEVERDAARS
jgi:Domain of unknown function (DUF4129)